MLVVIELIFLKIPKCRAFNTRMDFVGFIKYIIIT